MITYTEDLVASNDEELRDLADKYKWPGSGTQKDPYIIRDFCFTTKGTIYDTALYLKDIEDWTIIENCVFKSQNGASLNNIKNTTIKNCRFEYDAKGLYLSSVRDVLIQRCVFEHSGVHGLHYCRGIEARISSYIEISDCVFDCTEYTSDGIYTDESCDSLKIHHNRIIGQVESGINMKETHTSEVYENQTKGFRLHGIHIFSSSENQIHHNVCSCSTKSGLDINIVSSSQNSIIENECYGGEAGIHTNNATDNIIKGNIVSECQNGIYLYNSSGRNKILENDLRGSINVGITLNDSHNNTVSRNNCSGIGMRDGPPTGSSPFKGGILLWTSRNNRVEENICTHCGNGGILLCEDAHDNVVSKNDCSYTGPKLLPPGVRLSPSTYVGISVLSSSSNIVADNTCNNCTSSGIYVFGIGGTRILRNTCSENVVSGICIKNNLVSDIIENTCIRNGIYGILLEHAESIKLERNICYGNDIGVLLRKTRYITFEENRIKDNLSEDIVRMEELQD